MLHSLSILRFYLDLFEARAILLGRLGRHDAALETYVYRLQNFSKAEEYVAITVAFKVIDPLGLLAQVL